jgi:hypothetical protein
VKSSAPTRIDLERAESASSRENPIQETDREGRRACLPVGLFAVRHPESAGLRPLDFGGDEVFVYVLFLMRLPVAAALVCVLGLLCVTVAGIVAAVESVTPTGGMSRSVQASGRVSSYFEYSQLIQPFLQVP